MSVIQYKATISYGVTEREVSGVCYRTWTMMTWLMFGEATLPAHHHCYVATIMWIGAD